MVAMRGKTQAAKSCDVHMLERALDEYSGAVRLRSCVSVHASRGLYKACVVGRKTVYRYTV